jgi:hypothetical protein
MRTRNDRTEHTRRAGANDRLEGDFRDSRKGSICDVLMWACRVGNPAHPGYPGKPWIEARTESWGAVNAHEPRACFAAEMTQTGSAIAWRYASPQPAAQQPDTELRELGKWLNEEPNRPLDRVALARVLAWAQSAQQPVAVPDCHVSVIGHRWDSEAQHHIPQLLIEFDPVPANSPNDAKGWKDRDALAAMLAAAPTAPSREPQSQPQPQPRGYLLHWPKMGGGSSVHWVESRIVGDAIGCPVEPVYSLGITKEGGKA